METAPHETTAGTPDKPRRSALNRAARGSGGWLLRHPLGALQIVLIILLAIIVLQNLEPTSLDILFWTAVSLPKLVVMLISMVLGAIVWEWIRRRWRTPRRRRDAATTSRTRP